MGHGPMGRMGIGRKSFIELGSSNWVIFLILFLAILGAYYGSLNYPFINLDDPDYIKDNPYIRDMSWKGLYDIFSRPIVGNYFPIQIVSYTIDYQLWGLNPFGYRLHNVVLHVINAGLVFLLLKKIFSQHWIAFLSALLFALHPVQVESVTWVAERKNVLFAAFMLSSFLSYLYYVEEPRAARRKGFYLLTLFLFLLALLAKVAAVVLPLLLLLYDFCFQERKLWPMIREKIPFFVLTFLFSLITVLVYRSLHDMPGFHGGSPYTNGLAIVNVFVEYMIYLMIPVNLDHFYRTRIPETILETQVLLSLAAIFLFSLVAWKSFSRKRIFFFWFIWFFISLLPVLNIVPIAILRADRYMYLAAIGFFHLASLGLWKISRGENQWIRIPAFFLGILMVTGSYGFLTMERNKVWRSIQAFWEENIKHFPDSVSPYKLIGHMYLNEGNLSLAISYFRTGLNNNPDNVPLLNGLAIAFINKEDLGAAEDLLNRAQRIDPKDSVIYSNLGLVYMRRGDLEKGKAYFQKALSMDPKNHSARSNLGVIYFNLYRWDEAIEELENAVALSPFSLEPYLNLAVIYNLKGSLEKSEFYLMKALTCDPRSYDALLMLGKLCLGQGKIPEAKLYLTRAQRIKPRDGSILDLLSFIAQRENDVFSPKGTPGSPSPATKLFESTDHRSPGARIQ
jgi:protein O-mannosyl-transferase